MSNSFDEVQVEKLIGRIIEIRKCLNHDLQLVLQLWNQVHGKIKRILLR